MGVVRRRGRRRGELSEARMKRFGGGPVRAEVAICGGGCEFIRDCVIEASFGDS